MAKSKKSKGSSKPSVKVRDLKAKKNPKGGALNAYAKILPGGTAQIGDTKLIDPNNPNFSRYKKV